MYFQDQVSEASARLRSRFGAMADATAARVVSLRKSLSVLDAARIELTEIASRHGNRFVKQNSPLFAAVRKDVSDLARSTYRTLLEAPLSKRGRAKQSRKRARKAA